MGYCPTELKAGLGAGLGTGRAGWARDTQARARGALAWGERALGRWTLLAAGRAGARRSGRAELAERAAGGARDRLGERQQARGAQQQARGGARQAQAGARGSAGWAASAHLGVLNWARLGFSAP